MIPKEYDIEGKVAIVTGAGRGIGKGIALVLAECGADLVVAARTKEEIEQTADEIRKMGRRALAVPTDVGVTESVENMVKETVREFGKVDILVPNAAGSVSKPLVLIDGKSPFYSKALSMPKNPSGLTDEDLDTSIDLTLLSTTRCCRAVGPNMLKQRSGKIILIGSATGVVARPHSVAVGIAKAGVYQLCKILAVEWYHYNVQVNIISPGPQDTRGLRTRGKDEQQIRENDAFLEKMHKILPWGNLRSVGLLIAFLSSPAADIISGQNIFTNTMGYHDGAPSPHLVLGLDEQKP